VATPSSKSDPLPDPPPSPASGPLSVGTIMRHTRRYTPAEREAFDDLSGRAAKTADDAYLPDVLAIAPLTKLGGDLNYISRRMSWTVLGSAAPHELIEAELEVTHLDDSGSTVKIAFAARIRNEAGDVIITGQSNGIILKS
jgi:hypothetical protein